MNEEPTIDHIESPDNVSDTWLKPLKVEIPGYRVLKEIKRGGQAVVYQAEQDGTGLIVAVKVIHGGSQGDDSARERLQREARVLAVLTNLDHPNIVKVLGRGEMADGREFLVMNYIAGKELGDYLDDPRRHEDLARDPSVLLRLFFQICEAIEAAHRLGIVHRDLSPSNILVDGNQSPHILDFGLAKTAFDRFMQIGKREPTAPDQFLGKIRYASPEQADGRREKIDTRTDVYALGVMLYQILSGGRFPYSVDGSYRDILNNIVHTCPTPLSDLLESSGSADALEKQPIGPTSLLVINPIIEAIVLKALEKQPEHRYRSAGELGQDIGNYMAGKPTLAQPRDLNTPATPRKDVMQFTGLPQRQSLVRWATQLRELAEAHGDSGVVEQIDTAVAQLQAEKFIITILGKAKRGKSTLVNALLGRKDDLVAPIDKLPASSAISRFHWAESDQAAVTFRDGRTENVSFARIRQFVTEECNPENAKGVQMLEIGGRFPGLEQDLILVDTPGAGSMHEYHDALLHGFLPQSDAVIFLVTARMPIDQDEIDLLRAVKQADISKVFFAVNRVDETPPTDLNDAIAHNQKLLDEVGVSVDHFNRISAKRAFQGELLSSGVPQLVEEIQQFLARNKVKLLESRFQSRIWQAVEPLAQGLDVELSSAKLTEEELDVEIRNLAERKKSFENVRTTSESDFQRAWKRAVDEFGRFLPEAQSAVRNQISREIADASLIDIKRLAKELPTRLVKIVEKVLAPEGERLESSLRTACNKLQAEYPCIRIGPSGSAEIRLPGDSAVLTTTIGGAAAAATGYGLVTAGAATAAAIDGANAIALAATAEVAAPSLLAEGATWLGGLFGSWGEMIGGGVAALGTGTAVVSAPGAITTAPLWVAMSGPVGWTLAGVGALAIPLAWRSSKLKAKDALDKAASEQVEELFRNFTRGRIEGLRALGESVLDEVRATFERELGAIEAALTRARERKPNEKELASLQQMNSALRRLLAPLTAKSETPSPSSSCR